MSSVEEAGSGGGTMPCRRGPSSKDPMRERVIPTHGSGRHDGTAGIVRDGWDASLRVARATCAGGARWLSCCTPTRRPAIESRSAPGRTTLPTWHERSPPGGAAAGPQGSAWPGRGRRAGARRLAVFRRGHPRLARWAGASGRGRHAHPFSRIRHLGGDGSSRDEPGRWARDAARACAIPSGPQRHVATSSNLSSNVTPAYRPPPIRPARISRISARLTRASYASRSARDVSL